MRRNASAIAIVIALLLVLGGAYVGGYYMRSQVNDLLDTSGAISHRWRVFAHDWEAGLWKPMSAIESWVTGYPVEVSGPFDV